MSLRQQPGVPTTFPKRYDQRSPVQPHYDVDDDDQDADAYDDSSLSRLPRSARRWQDLTTEQPQGVVTSQEPHRIVRYRYQQVPPRQSRTQDAVLPISSSPRPLAPQS